MSSGNLVLSGSVVNRPFFEAAVELSDTASPAFAIDCFGSTTQKSFEEGVEYYRTQLNKRFGSKVIMLQSAYDVQPSRDEYLEAISAADILYVGGGDTRKLGENWQSLDLVEELNRRVKQERLVACGASAGALIWFQQGFSDSEQYVPGNVDWDYIYVAGTGLINAWANVHHTGTDTRDRSREDAFQASLYEISPPEQLSAEIGSWQRAIGIESGAALVCTGGVAHAIDLMQDPGTEPCSAYLYEAPNSYMPRRLEPGETITL